jgi:predicted nucleic acid-binding protein
MELVIDTSVVLAVVANEPEKAELVRLTAGADLIAPASIPWEIGNALSAMLKRNRIRLEQAKQAVDAYRQIPIRFVDVDLGQAVELSGQLGIYAYDAYLIACAVNQHCALLTLDRGLIHAAHQAGVEVREVA